MRLFVGFLTLMISVSSYGVYVECPSGSKSALATLVVAPHDCRSQVIVAYKSDSSDFTFSRGLSCATENSIQDLLKNKNLREQDLIGHAEYSSLNPFRLLICIQELEGKLTADSQPLANVTSIQQNIEENGGRVFESNRLPQ